MRRVVRPVDLGTPVREVSLVCPVGCRFLSRAVVKEQSAKIASLYNATMGGLRPDCVAAGDLYVRPVFIFAATSTEIRQPIAR